MVSIRPLPEFTHWLDRLEDETIRGIVVARIKRLSLGLMGDVQPVGEGVSELRIHVGTGWRVFHPVRGKIGRTACRGIEANSETGHKARQGVSIFA